MKDINVRKMSMEDAAKVAVDILSQHSNWSNELELAAEMAKLWAKEHRHLQAVMFGCLKETIDIWQKEALKTKFFDGRNEHALLTAKKMMEAE